MKTTNKQDRAEKPCAACGRPFQWRKKWKNNWEEVKYCSDRCRKLGNKNTPQGKDLV